MLIEFHGDNKLLSEFVIMGSLFQALGSWERKKGEREKKEGRTKARKELLNTPRLSPPSFFFLAPFRSSPTTESLEQARSWVTGQIMRF